MFKGLRLPTSMAFLGINDILVLEKNNGTVLRIVDGKMFPEPLLHVNVDTKGESGMLGIAVARNVTRNTVYVFLYYTESATRGIHNATAGIQPRNHLYRYELVNNRLVNPILLLDLPTSPISSSHNGGKILIGPDTNVYIGVGDLDKFYTHYHLTRAQNIQNGSNPGWFWWHT